MKYLDLIDMKAVVLTKKAMILEFVEVVRFEIEGGKKKKISASNDELVQKIWDRVKGEAMNFSTEKELRRHLESVTREMLWLEANTEESDEIIRRLKSGDASFTEDFFYDNDPKGCNISRFRSKILSQIKRTYGVEVTVKEFGTLLYTFLWNEGTWSVLDKYSRKSSFFAWLAEVARHELRRYLEMMGLVPPCRERTVGNTRLLGMSVDPELWDYILSDMMPQGPYREVLHATLVVRQSEAEIAKAFGMDKKALRTLQKKAEADLRDRLIRSDCGYEELVLRDKSPRHFEVSEEFAMDFCAWQESKFSANPLSDILGVELDKEEQQAKVIEFLQTIIGKLKWSDVDRLVWTLRFIENTAPVEVAERIGRKRSWVDTRYSRLNAHFRKAIKNWWAENNKKNK